MFASIALVACGLVSPAIEDTLVFAGGEGGFATYRIPAVCVAPDGSILAFCEGRSSMSDPGTKGGINRLVWRRSVDGGRTWSSMERFDYPHENGIGDAGNPELVVDSKTKTVFAVYNKWPEGKGLLQVGPGLDPGKSCTIWVRESRDNGKTWSPERDITASVKDAAWCGCPLGPGAGIQLKKGKPGRLLVTGYRLLSRDLRTGDPWVFYSDDHGKTWQKGGVADGPDGVANGDESLTVELRDGRLLMNSRFNYAKKRLQFVSADCGETWTAFDPAVLMQGIAGDCAGSIVRAPGRNAPLLFSGPEHPDRADLAVWASFDEGKSYPAKAPIHSGSAAYSCMATLKDGSVIVLYEADDYKQIRIARFKPKDVGLTPPKR